MDLRDMSWSRDDVRCRSGDLLKTSVPGKHQNDRLVLGAFTQIGAYDQVLAWIPEEDQAT